MTDKEAAERLADSLEHFAYRLDGESVSLRALAGSIRHEYADGGSKLCYSQTPEKLFDTIKAHAERWQR